MMAITPTDQTVPVAKGTKLDVNNFAGDVNVKVWDKDAVRVEVNNSDRETVDIKPVDQVLRIRSRSTRGGPPRSLDYTITVPSWMAIAIAGTYADVTLAIQDSLHPPASINPQKAIDTLRSRLNTLADGGMY